MASCAVCGKREEDIILYDGVYDGKISKVCYNCSLAEGIALVKKPTQAQLEEAQKRLSVKELMEKMSSPQQKLMMKDQSIAHKNLVKIKFPAMKQEHGDLVENYDWLLKQGRRRMKLSVTQVSERTGMDRGQIESLESGQLFAGFEKVAYALEKLYDVKILKSTVLKTRVVRTPEEKKIEEEKIVEEAVQTVAPTEKKSWFSFMKRKEKVAEPAEEMEISEAPVEEEIEPIAEVDFPQVQEASPWMVAREKQRSVSPKEFRHEQVRQGVAQLNNVSHEKIDVADIRKEKEDERKQRREGLYKRMESDEFDFSKKENLDKVTLQDLADLKKKKENVPQNQNAHEVIGQAKQAYHFHKKKGLKEEEIVNMFKQKGWKDEDIQKLK